MRALLDFMRENAAVVQDKMLLPCQDLMMEASELKVLSTTRGKLLNKELFKAFSAELERMIAPG